MELAKRLVQLSSARQYDVTVVQKALLSVYLKGMLSLLKRNARRVIYDIDDAVHLASPNPMPRYWRFWEDKSQINKLFQIADLVLAGNNWLREEARSHGARAELFPTVVDTDRFVPKRQNEGKYTLGWIGSPSTAGMLNAINIDLSCLPNTHVLLIGMDKAQNPWQYAVVEPWGFETEVGLIQSCSVGLMPSEKSPWARGKCGLKALQYMACGIPCIATPFGAALEIIREGETGLFADTPAAWKKAVEILRDDTVRERMGAAARADVEKRFSLNKAAPELVQWLHSVI